MLTPRELAWCIGVYQTARHGLWHNPHGGLSDEIYQVLACPWLAGPQQQPQQHAAAAAACSHCNVTHRAWKWVGGAY